MIELVWLAIGCISTVVLLGIGVWFGFYVANKNLEIQLNRMERDEVVKKKPVAEVTVEKETSGAVKMTPKELKMEENKEFNDKLESFL
jgi:hypothetical protein